jgi:hypothetical protein
MSIKDVSELVHFRELHLLPRTIFSIGAVCFVGAFFLKSFLLGFLGVGTVFVALTLNFAINILVRFGDSIQTKQFAAPWMMIAQFLLCLFITYFLLTLVYYYYRQGQLPPYLRPLPPPH